MFAKIGANCYIEPPLHANWGGAHVHMGAFVYANFQPHPWWTTRISSSATTA